MPRSTSAVDTWLHACVIGMKFVSADPTFAATMFAPTRDSNFFMTL